MKKIITRLIAYFLILGLIVIVPAMVIDPYNVFHPYKPSDNGIESNKGFIKTEYLKKHYSEFDSLLFGSSRAGFVDIGYLNEALGASFYDMASSESLVREQYIELKELIDSGFVPKRVWVLVDDISCFVDPKIHENRLYRVAYPSGKIFDRAEFYLKYTDPVMLVDSLKIINETKEKKAQDISNGIDNSFDDSTGMSYLERYYHTGTERLDKPSQFDPNEEQYQKGYWVDYYSLRTSEAINDIRDFANLCDKYNIELTVVTNPLYYLTYRQGIENGYLSYIEALSQVTDFYNFSSFSDVTEDYTYYYETSHFMPSVTRMMIDCIVLDKCDQKLRDQGFGVKVTRENVSELMELLKSQAEEKNVSVYGVELR